MNHEDDVEKHKKRIGSALHTRISARRLELEKYLAQSDPDGDYAPEVALASVETGIARLVGMWGDAAELHQIIAQLLDAEIGRQRRLLN